MCDFEQSDMILDPNGLVGVEEGEFICYDDENNAYLIEIEDEIVEDIPYADMKNEFIEDDDGELNTNSSNEDYNHKQLMYENTG